MEHSQSRNMDYKFVDIRQKQFRKFQIILKQLQPEEWENEMELPVNLYLDKLCVAAVQAEWFDGEAPDIDDLYPKEVNDLGTEIAKIYGEIIAPDPN